MSAHLNASSRSPVVTAGNLLHNRALQKLPRYRSTTVRNARRPLAVRAAAEADVVVVGAGIAGLSAAAKLSKQGVNTLLVEASDGVGGRVRTDVHEEGFLLDRGFQIFLAGYPNAKATLDYAALDLKPFYAGAQVRYQGQFHRVADPFRHPVDGVLSLTNPVGTVLDKVRVGLLRTRTLLGSWEDLLQGPETTIAQCIETEGFTPAIRDLFFRPFLGGIFFDRTLSTSSRLFLFVMRTLASGPNCLPAAGIGAMTQQLAAQLPPSNLRLNTKVDRVEGSSGDAPAKVVLQGGEVISAKRGVIVAADGPEAARMLGPVLEASPLKPPPGVGTCCLYFAAPRDPLGEGVLYLNGESTGIVNNCCFPSTVAPSYAPAGQALASVSTVGTFEELSDEQLEAQVRQQLGDWFGSQEVAAWRLLRIYRIPFAQPRQDPPTDLRRPVVLGRGLYVCGDHRDTATFDGAIVSGQRAADALLEATK